MQERRLAEVTPLRSDPDLYGVVDRLTARMGVKRGQLGPFQCPNCGGEALYLEPDGERGVVELVCRAPRSEWRPLCSGRELARRFDVAEVERQFRIDGRARG